MSTHPYLPLYVDDYEAATAHLTAAEDGIYSRLLRLCWRTPGCSLPNDDAWIARKIRLSAAEFAKVAKPVIEEFFSVQRGRLVQKRLKAEYENISRKKSARVNAGKMGGAAKALKTKRIAPSNATVLPAHTRAFPEPEPEPEKKELSTNVERRAPVLVKGCSLPEGWLPNPDDFVTAIDLIGAERAAAELEKFTDYWRGVPGAKGRKLDWPATYRNWIRRTAESTARNAKPDKLAARHDNYAASWTGADGAAELMAARRAF